MIVSSPKLSGSMMKKVADQGSAASLMPVSVIV